MDPKNTGYIRLNLNQVHGRDLLAPPLVASPAILPAPAPILGPACFLPTVAADNHVGLGSPGSLAPTATATSTTTTVRSLAPKQGPPCCSAVSADGLGSS